jgi:hypothetical protein
MLEVEQTGLEVVTYNITNAASLAQNIAQIAATANDNNKFARVNITGNLGLQDSDKQNLKILKNLKTSRPENIGVEWNGRNIYPAFQGVKLTHAEWLEMDSPSIGQNPTGAKFEVTQEDLTKFPSHYHGMLIVPATGDLTVTISSVSELAAKVTEAVNVANSGAQVLIRIISELTVNSAHTATMRPLGDHPNITFASDSRALRAGASEVIISGPLAIKAGLVNQGRYPMNMFKILGADNGANMWVQSDASNGQLVKTDTLTHGRVGADYEKLLPKTLYFKFHGVNVNTLAHHMNSPYVIECHVIEDSSLPGNKPAMGFVTSNVLAMMQTPGTNKPAGQYVLYFTVHPVVSTYMTKDGFDREQALPAGTPANTMRLLTVGDSIQINLGRLYTDRTPKSEPKARGWGKSLFPISDR